MSDTETANPPGPAPADVDPVESTVTTSTAPPPQTAPEQDQDTGDTHGERLDGVPAAHLAAGGLSAGAVALGAVYQLLGLPGLIAGGVLTGGGAVAYVRHRYQRRRSGRTWGTSWEDGHTGHGRNRRGRRSRRSGGGGDVLGGLRSEGRASRPAGRTRTGGGGVFSGRSGRSAGGGSRSGGPGVLGGLFGGARRSEGGSAGRSRSTEPKGRRTKRDRSSSPNGSAHPTDGKRKRHGTGKDKDSAGSRQRGPLGAARRVAATTGTAGRNFARMSRRAAKGSVRMARRGADRVRKGAASVNAKTGGRAGRAYRAVGQGARRAVRGAGRAAAAQARRAGAWADRRTGKRISSAWKAAKNSKKGEGFSAARRRAAEKLDRWYGPVAAPLLALLAVLVQRWRRRKTRNPASAESTEAAETTGDTTAETPSTGDPALTETIFCPRCGTSHTVTIPVDQPDHTITCGCGHTIRVFREPNDPPEEPASTGQTAESTPAPEGEAASAGAGARRHPYLASPSPTYRRNRVMSAFPLVVTAAEMNAAAASHTPADMWVVARELDQLAEVPANVALAIRTYTTRLQSDYPINPAVVEAIHHLYQAQAVLVTLAEEIGPLFRRVHAEDLKREEAPRTNEPLWNV
ncbi:hypothetical protein ABT340_22390 [Streptosporangium sp. NPDC000239]|uniref:hypothetical protein n=1 Tax=Streptosporangium sp. NPDC000239 TaxID=3154248 RepID=UPI00332A0FD4